VEAPKLDSTYYGPLLIEEGFAVESLQSWLLPPVYAPKTHLLPLKIPIRAKSYINPLGHEKLLPEGSRVTWLPFLTQFKGIPVQGAFEIDEEGIIPDSSLVLIDDGLLVQRFAERIPSAESKKATGHNLEPPYLLDAVINPSFNKKRQIENGGFLKWELQKRIPGTLHIETRNGITDVELKKMLLTEARKAGLPFALILGTPCRKIFTDTEHEEPVYLTWNANTLFWNDPLNPPHILAFSKQERVEPYFDHTCIAPESLLLDRARISAKIITSH